MSFLRFIQVMFAFAMVLNLTSCIDKSSKVPENVMSKEEMVEVISESQLIEAIRQRGTILPKDLNPQDEAKRQYALLFEKHNITEDQFKESYQWYLEHPQLLAEIYDLVLEQLTKEQANIQSEMKPKKVKVDKSKADTAVKPKAK
tara:strand:- start:22 stop:456 length:435 start_codon:yes stop_codon:yes gene_type:complete